MNFILSEKQQAVKAVTPTVPALTQSFTGILGDGNTNTTIRDSKKENERESDVQGQIPFLF